MSIQEAAKIVYGTEATNSINFELARKVLFEACKRGYKFNTKGEITRPVYLQQLLNGLSNK